MLLTLLLSFFLSGPLDWRRLFVGWWDILVYCMLLVLGLLYSSDIERGLRLLETRFSLLAMPIIFWRASVLNEKDVFAVAKYFSRGLVVACAICFGNAWVTYSQTGDNSAFLYENLTAIVNAQPTYFAYYIIFSITFGLYSLYYHPHEIRNNLTLLSVLFLFVMLILTGGKTTFISLLLIFSFFVLKFILEDKSWHKSIVFTMVCLMLLAMFIVNSIEHWAFEGDYWERMVLWKSAIIANPSPLWGVGTGDFNNVLNEYYRTHNLIEFSQGDFNAHNQLIQSYLTHGLLGLGALIIVLTRPLFDGSRSHDTLTIMIFFPFLIYGITEVFLGRYQGVVFFALVKGLTTILARREQAQMLDSHA
jgi:O-antigen ligase